MAEKKYVPDALAEAKEAYVKAQQAHKTSNFAIPLNGIKIELQFAQTAALIAIAEALTFNATKQIEQDFGKQR